jgi:hypothetical protein
MNSSYPRLLVATEFPPNGSGGGAAIVRQMLKDWPSKHLYWWSRTEDVDQRFGRHLAGHAIASIPKKLVPYRKFPKIKTRLLEFLWEPWAARHLSLTVRKWKPDVIWAIPHAWAIPPMAKFLPQGNTGFHVSIHDYADDQRAVQTMGERRARKLASLTDSLYSLSTTRDAICEAMVLDLKRRTGSDGHVSHAGLEASEFAYLENHHDIVTDSIRIAFVGSISAENTFQIFVKALGSVKNRFSRPITIEIFSAHSYADRVWFDSSWMNERGNLAEPLFSQELRKCSWGFAPMSLAEDDPRHRFSFSTKFISYISAGLPIFTIGHEDTGVVQMARKYDVGVCSSSGDLRELENLIAGALAIELPWQKFGREIIRCASLELNASVLREELHSSFQVCAAKTLCNRRNSSMS